MDSEYKRNRKIRGCLFLSTALFAMCIKFALGGVKISMEKKETTRLTAEELYYLSCQMKAKYIDYSYITALEDIQKNFAKYEREAKTGLIKKGHLEEDFSGNLEIAPEVQTLLKPVFFGEFESSMDICGVGETGDCHTKFHFMENDVIEVKKEGMYWCLTKVGKASIKEKVKSCLKEYIHSAEYTFEEKKVTQIFVFKHLFIGKESVVKIIFDCAGDLFTENDTEEILPTTFSQIEEEITEVLLGEENK